MKLRQRVAVAPGELARDERKWSQAQVSGGKIGQIPPAVIPRSHGTHRSWADRCMKTSGYPTERQSP